METAGSTPNWLTMSFVGEKQATYVISGTFFTPASYYVKILNQYIQKYLQMTYYVHI